MDKNKIKSLLNEGKSENRLALLLEELETKATKKSDPEVKNPELSNSDLFSSKAKDEVKEVIVESTKLSAKQKMAFLLEKYGVENLVQLAGEERNRFLKELNNPTTKFISPNVLLENIDTAAENKNVDDANRAAADKGDAALITAKAKKQQQDRLSKNALNTDGSHLLNDAVQHEKEELEPEVESPDPEKDPEFDGEFDDDKKIKNKNIDNKEGDDTIKAKDKALDSVNESLESIFDILMDSKPLFEEEVTGKGEVAMTDNEATKESDGEVAKPTTTNNDIFTTDEHKQDEEVKELVIEGELPEALKKNMKDDKDDSDKTPEKLEDGSKDEDHDEKSDDDEKESKDDDKDDKDSKADKKLEEGEIPEQFKKSADKEDSKDDDKDSDKKDEKSDDKDDKEEDDKDSKDDKKLEEDDKDSKDDKKLEEGEIPEQFKKSDDKEESKDDEKSDKKDDDKEDDSKEDKKEELKEAELLPKEEEKKVGIKQTEKISDTVDSEGTLKPVEVVEPQLKGGEISAKPHDDADAEGKKERAAVLEDVTVKGDVAMTDNIATKETDGEAKEPTTTNTDILPTEEHKEVEEIEEVIVENSVELSNAAVFISIPINEGE